MTLSAALVLGYLLGAIPSAELAARWRGHRIFDVGSGNMGAMNTARNLGWGLGIAVFLADVGKGIAATAAGLALAAAGGLDDAGTLPVALAAGFGAVAGHGWSAFVGGRGGKALATMLGVSLPLYPVGGLAGALVLVVLTALTRNATLAAVATLLAYPWLVALIALLTGGTAETAMSLLAGTAAVALLSLIRHALAARTRPRPGATVAPGTSHADGPADRAA